MAPARHLREVLLAAALAATAPTRRQPDGRWRIARYLAYAEDE